MEISLESGGTIPRDVGSEARASHILVADALRAAAILLVFSFHLVLHTRPAVGTHSLTLWFLGVLGVNCFFVLTGFLLGRPFMAALLNEKVRMPSFRQFYLRRLLRIYPLYLFALMVTAVCLSIFTGRAPATGNIVAHVFFLQGLFPQYVDSIDSPMWTMGIDVSFYLLLPVAMWVLARVLHGAQKSSRIGMLTGLLIVLAGASIAYRFTQLTHHPSALFDSSASLVYVRNVFGMLTAFAGGLGVALLAEAKITPSRSAAGLAVAVGAVLAILGFLLRLDANLAPTTSAIVRVSIMDPLAAVASCLILFGLVNGNYANVRAFTNSNVVQGTAALSYGIYLFHAPIINAVQAMLFENRAGGLALFVQMSLATALFTFAVASLTYRFVEKPFLDLKKRYGSR